jgi:N-dimethylarginine dimethylaminohydrolase
MPLEGGEILYFPAAFTSEGLEQLRSRAPAGQLIEVAEEDAQKLAINAVNVGRNVVLAAGAPRLCEQLRERGYTPLEVDLTPFIQSGGASFCMTLRLDWQRG